MPKGFLVKRSKRAGAFSYRIRDYSEPNLSLTQVAGASTFVHLKDNAPLLDFAQTLPLRTYFGGMPESLAPSHSPTRPDSEVYNNQYPTDTEPLRSSESSSMKAVLPEPILGNFAVNGSPATPSLPEMASKLDPVCKQQSTASGKRPVPMNTKTQTGAKKRKTTTNSPNRERRTVSRDEVTTSPVLGLRIKEEVEEDLAKSSNTVSPNGGFVCQLCKQSYQDPLSLAHHKCSRIVRVEYRCTECDKAFSCPANLASHKRWHKPRIAPGESPSPPQEESKTAAGRGMDLRDTACLSPQASDSASDEDMPFSCSLCGKKFRRQAYLRKHLALHSKKASGQQQNPLFPDASVAASSPSPRAEERGMPEDLGPIPANAQTPTRDGEVYHCRFCGDNFYSSPGLTRHINKYHPTESRHVIFLSRTV